MMHDYIYIYILFGNLLPPPPKKIGGGCQEIPKKKKTTTTIEKLSLPRNLHYVLATTY